MHTSQAYQSPTLYYHCHPQHPKLRDFTHTRVIRDVHATKYEGMWYNKTNDDGSISKKRSMIRDFIMAHDFSKIVNLAREKEISKWRAYMGLNFLRKSLK